MYLNCFHFAAVYLNCVLLESKRFHNNKLTFCCLADLTNDNFSEIAVMHVIAYNCRHVKAVLLRTQK